MHVLQVGLGPLGRLMARDVHLRSFGSVVSAVDIDPQLAGTPLSELVPEASDECTVSDSLDDVRTDGIDVAIVTTSSGLEACAPTFRSLLTRGLSVVSTCEELLYPRLQHPALADELDSLARSHGGRLLGTGVNPGLLMDTLPALLTGACRQVTKVSVWRVQDAATRREPFQRKIGAGLDAETFHRRAEAGTLRHVGLRESAQFLAEAIGMEHIKDYTESLEPVRTDRALQCGIGDIPPGGIAGVRQVAKCRDGTGKAIRLEFIAAIGQTDPHDRVRIDGDPEIDLTIPGGIHGDIATIAMTLNVIEPLLAAPAGLHTMRTIGVPSCRYHV